MYMKISSLLVQYIDLSLPAKGTRCGWLSP